MQQSVAQRKTYFDNQIKVLVIFLKQYAKDLLPLSHKLYSDEDQSS